MTRSPQRSQRFQRRALTLAIASLMSIPAGAAVHYDLRDDAHYDMTGDLSIYQPPIGDTKPTVMLMLDRSGSMGNHTQRWIDPKNNARSARMDSLWMDYGSVDYKYNNNYITVTSIDERGYSRNNFYSYYTPSLIGKDKQPCYYGKRSAADVTDYLQDKDEKGARYLDDFKDNFLTATRTEPSGHSYPITYCIDTRAADTRSPEAIAAGDIPTNWRLDRMSALKAAVFKLLRNPQMSDTVSVGAGSFGYNFYSASPDSKFGKIGVAAKPLTDTHKDSLRVYVAGLVPFGSTPTASALAEAGAYVLGNQTSYGGEQLSGFLNTDNDGVIRNSSHYLKPQSSQCAGTGIYLLTDGEPNGGHDFLSGIMRSSLDSSSLDNSRFECNGAMSDKGTDSSIESGWRCMGDYAKALSGRGIKTAMVGFGGSFKAFENPDNYQSIQSVLSDGTVYDKKYYRCDLLPTADAKNSCNLGMESTDQKTGFTGFPDAPDIGGFGEGGFYYAKDSKDIVNSVLSFISKLDNDLPSMASGTITIPKDPLSAQNIQPYAYLPMLEPKVGSNLIVWPGNLKKYAVKQGTLYGRSASGAASDTRLYVHLNDDGTIDTTGQKFPSDINPNARDLWSTQNYQEADEDGNLVNINNRITAGGFYANLTTPSSASNSTRTLYVEDGGSLQRLRVADGVLEGFDALEDYSTAEKLYLLSFLGYDITITDTLITQIDTAADPDATLAALVGTPTGDIKVLGGVLHSQPTLVSYGGRINAAEKDDDEDGVIDADAGQISTDDSDRTDYVMFGSMEGALHLAASASGEEAIAFVPKTLIKTHVRALKAGSESTDPNEHIPVFGVDAPWISAGKYRYQFAEDGSGRVLAHDMKIYGGLSKGGIGIYGLDVSDIAKPTKLFALNQSSVGYGRLGMVMSKPVMGKMKIGTGKNNLKDVIIFGGGYDSCYEDPTFRLGTSGNRISGCDNKTQAQGNAVYVTDAHTGALLLSISADISGGKNLTVSSMTHSIVSEITTLDRNNDGLIDHLYFGDLGGQLYRVDLQNGKPVRTSAGINGLVRRVSRVLNASGDSSSDATSRTLAAKGLQYRFYAQPSVSFYADGATNGGRMAVVNIASGDRSNPLSRNRTGADEANRLFGIIDRDLVAQNLYGQSRTLLNDERTLADMALMPFNTVTTPEGAAPIAQTKRGVIGALKSGVFQGWSYPLSYFDGYDNVKHVKSMGTGAAIGGIYYATVYSPEMKYDTRINPCSAQVIGGSERQLYCLPWGICENDSATNGMGGFVRGGKGIQELALGAYDETKTNVQVLIGNQSFSEQIASGNRTGYGRRSLNNGPNVIPHSTNGSGRLSDTKGMGSAAIFGNMSGYRLHTQRWYEKSADQQSAD